MQLSKRETLNTDGSVRVRIWVSEASEELPTAVFVYQTLQRSPNDSGVVETQEQFLHVAGFSDVLALSETPDPERMAYHRRGYVDLTFNNAELQQSTWQGIQAHIRELLHTVSERLGYPNAMLTIEELS